tara:strand:+ start:306 stop:788 length:483 start_codon:yes stop_codon:yes gene_type:complete
MKKLSKLINSIIKEELSIINKKIIGPVLLEILKYKIIDKIKTNNLVFIPKNIVDENEEIITEDESRAIKIKLNSFKSSVTNLNSIIKNNQLIICLNKIITINFENFKTKKIIEHNCIPMTGILLPEGSKCSFNYPKDAVVLYLSTSNKFLSIEKLDEITI